MEVQNGIPSPYPPNHKSLQMQLVCICSSDETSVVIALIVLREATNAS